MVKGDNLHLGESGFSCLGWIFFNCRLDFFVYWIESLKGCFLKIKMLGDVGENCFGRH